MSNQKLTLFTKVSPPNDAETAEAAAEATGLGSAKGTEIARWARSTNEVSGANLESICEERSRARAGALITRF